jgi:hypothetical protein
MSVMELGRRREKEDEARAWVQNLGQPALVALINSTPTSATAQE